MGTETISTLLSVQLHALGYSECAAGKRYNNNEQLTGNVLLVLQVGRRLQVQQLQTRVDGNLQLDLLAKSEGDGGGKVATGTVSRYRYALGIYFQVLRVLDDVLSDV